MKVRQWNLGQVGNAAQSRVAISGKHKFIDKVHVRYSEKQECHWASLENFNSQRVAIPDKLYRDNDRLLDSGIWADPPDAHATNCRRRDHSAYCQPSRIAGITFGGASFAINGSSRGRITSA